MSNIQATDKPVKKPRAKKAAAAKTTTAKSAATKTTKSTATPKTVTSAKNRETITEAQRQQMINEAAYYRAEQRGFSGGNPEQDWLDAEAEVNSKIGL